MIHSHHEHIPAFGMNSTHPEDIHVKPGVELVISGEKTYRHIYVDGEGTANAVLRLTDGCKLNVQTIFLNGLKAALEADNIACEVIWHGLPLNTTNPDADEPFDPQQFGCGLIVNSGEVVLRGENPRTAKARLRSWIAAGDWIIGLNSVPPNWQVGDVLCLPSTRQLKTGEVLSWETEYVTIKAIEENWIELTSPTKFDHGPLRNDDRSIRELPEIANVTQSIVFRSANPDGVRGHAIFMDHCLLDMQGVVFRDMGRTTTAPLHSTKWEPHLGPASVEYIGTNQIGRYAFHEHGMPGRENSPLPGGWQSHIRNFAIVGSPKLGFVKHHSSHFGLVEDFAIVDCAGADIVHETPNVYGNVYRRGFLCGLTVGSNDAVTSRAGRNAAGGDHWHGGVGLGLQSMMNEFHDIGIYARKEGIAMVGFATSGLFEPTKRGVHTTTDNRALIKQLHSEPDNKQKAYPFQPTSGVYIWGCWKGVEAWTANAWYDSPKMFEGLKIIHTQKPTDFQDQRRTELFDWKILGDYSLITPVKENGEKNTFGLDFKDSYRFGIVMHGGEISGHDCAYNYVLDTNATHFIGVHFDCPVIAYHPLGRYFPQVEDDFSDTCFHNCTWGPRVEKFMDGWFSKYPFNLKVAPAATPNLSRRALLPITTSITPWKDGCDYKVYFPEQHKDFALPAILPDMAYGDWPAGVNTNAELIARGTPIYGDVIPSNAIQRADFGPFYAVDVTVVDPPPPFVDPPLTLRQRVERLEIDRYGEPYPNPAIEST
jgi:hypothetical protein